MKIFFTTISQSPYLELPQGLVGWAGWLGLLGIVAALLWWWRGYNKPWGKKQIWIFIILAASIPITSLFFGFKLPTGSALPPPKIPENPSDPIVLVLSAIPWVLAAGLLGPTPAASLALISGASRSLWNNHNIFFPLEMALLAVLFSVAISQRYRTKIFRIIRHPIVVALLLTIFYPFVSLMESLLTEQGVFVNRLDYAFTHLTGATLAIGIELLIAGVFAEVIAVIFSSAWGKEGPLVPSPSERSLLARFLYSMAPLALILILTLMAGDWIVAGNAARDMLKARMENATQMASESVPSLLETGQNLISQMANNPQLYSDDPNEVTKVLSEASRTVPYFRQIYVLDNTGSSVTGYPLEYYVSNQAPLEEQKGIQIALSGVPVQVYTIPPAPGGTTAQLTFIAGIKDNSGAVHGVLIGHSDFETNPFTRPIMTSLDNLSAEGGQGMLLDEDGNILYHPDPNQVMNTYTGSLPEGVQFFDDTAPDGTRRLVSYQPVIGYPWSVVMTVPARLSQQLALTIAAPLLGIILLLSVIAVFFFLIAIRAVTHSLQNLSLEAGRISQGQLDHPLRIDGEDEIGRLRRSFEQMRVSLKARL
ncbi:MAG: cache and HAMP domain-containing protein, partial [Anaerolineales bacterium]